MPEIPDFEKIARRLSNEAGHSGDGAVTYEFAATLRLVWNARGAADLVKIEAELSTLMGSTAAGPYVKSLDRALRSLDR